MNDISSFSERLNVSSINNIVDRPGVSVFEAFRGDGERLFVKCSEKKEATERYCEILLALTEFTLSPNIIDRFEWEGRYIVVLNAIDGNRLDNALSLVSGKDKIALLESVGFSLGKLHRAISQPNLLSMNFWKERDGSEYDSSLWGLHLQKMIAKWMSRVNTSASDYGKFSAHLKLLEQKCLSLREPSEISLLHCDYVGRNILVGKDNVVTGILDFDAARIGDAVYDLAKIVWVNIDYDDISCRTAVLKGWESSFGEIVPKHEFLCYVGVQCLAAIAWVDKNLPLSVEDEFRNSAIKTLNLVMEEI